MTTNRSKRKFLRRNLLLLEEYPLCFVCHGDPEIKIIGESIKETNNMVKYSLGEMIRVGGYGEHK